MWTVSVLSLPLRLDNGVGEKHAVGLRNGNVIYQICHDPETSLVGPSSLLIIKSVHP